MKTNEHMKWSRLLNWQRLGQTAARDIDPTRPPWQIDYDRVVFSSAFRRLQDKTQVFPLSGSDYVRTRLTHSMEVSTVARTLGMMAGQYILNRYGEEEVTRYDENGLSFKSIIKSTYSINDFGALVAVAALAHDLGNPPFGHSGEDAVRYWFKNSPQGKAAKKALKSKEQVREFERWEGNAQGFRILTKLQMRRDKGGMQLTNATLGAFTKYPVLASQCGRKGSRFKKYGFFSSEKDLFKTVATTLGLLPSRGGGWCRHPLAFVMEAADDVCNPIVDFEDGVRMGCIDKKEAIDMLMEIIPSGDRNKTSRALDGELDDTSRVGYLRAVAIRQLVKEVAEAFRKKEPLMLKGEYDGDLIAETIAGRKNGPLGAIRERISSDVYTNGGIIETEAAGFEIIGALLDLFWPAVNEAASGSPSTRARKILLRIPDEFVGPKRQPDKDPYIRLLRVTDYVTGMTDRYALSLFRKLKGITLPG